MPTPLQILELIDNLVSSADSTGCSEDLTVVSSKAVEALSDYASSVREITDASPENT